MSNRALSLASALFLLGVGTADTAFAQAQNLEAGKSPSQIFAQTCNACHKSPRGLLKSVSPGSLPGFLRQHYTTSSEMAGVLASYLVSNGATDTRYGGGQAKGGKERGKEKEANTNAAPETSERVDFFGRRLRPPQEVAKPEGEGATPAPEIRRSGKKRVARPNEESGAKQEATPGEQPATSERGAEGHKAKRLSRHGKPKADEAPKASAAKQTPATTEPLADDKKGEPEQAKPERASSESEPVKTETGTSQPTEPQPAKVEPTKTESTGDEAPAPRPDPSLSTTPTPPAAANPADSAASGAGGPDAASARPEETPPPATVPAGADSK